MKIILLPIVITVTIGHLFATPLQEITVNAGQPFQISHSCATHCTWEILEEEPAAVQLMEICTVTKPRQIGARTLVYRFLPLKAGTSLLVFQATNKISKQPYAKAYYLITAISTEQRIWEHQKKMVPYAVLAILGAVGAGYASKRLLFEVMDPWSFGPDSIINYLLLAYYIGTCGATTLYTGKHIAKLYSKIKQLKADQLSLEKETEFLAE
jgi:hypothetical protein